jgi:hypothetical protein
MRQETDSMKVGKFMLTWRDSITKIHEKINEAQLKINNHIDETRTDKNFSEYNDYKEKI